MPKVYVYECGHEIKYGVAANEQEAYDNRVEVDEKFFYTPCDITELTIEGYTVEAKAKKTTPAKE